MLVFPSLTPERCIPKLNFQLTFATAGPLTTVCFSMGQFADADGNADPDPDPDIRKEVLGNLLARWDEDGNDDENENENESENEYEDEDENEDEDDDDDDEDEDKDEDMSYLA
ncbi:hypothetical protein EsDP_00000996 [Epichloe bromicola]|uniref:Uncharacterized protein n=1 Tax=Epichloe bromicola TaxID=79588 RepID=A0ABQ0CGM1_9HYPO